MDLLSGRRPLQIAVVLIPTLLFGNVSWAQDAHELAKQLSNPIASLAGLRYWAESPDTGPDGLGFRTGITFLFPKK